MIYKSEDLIIKPESRYRKKDNFPSICLIVHTQKFLDILKSRSDVQISILGKYNYRVTYGEKDVLVINTHLGSEETSKRIIENYFYGIRTFINVGSCGIFYPDSFDKLIVSTKVHKSNYSSLSFADGDESAEASQELVERFQNYTSKKGNVIFGQTLCTATLYYPKTLIEKAIANQAIGVEMEMEIVYITTKWLNYNYAARFGKCASIGIHYVSDVVLPDKEWADTLTNKELLNERKQYIVSEILPFMKDL